MLGTLPEGWTVARTDDAYLLSPCHVPGTVASSLCAVSLRRLREGFCLQAILQIKKLRPRVGK